MASVFDRIWQPLNDWWNGWGWGNRTPQVVQPDEAERQPQPDAQGERTDRQDGGGTSGGGWGGTPTPKGSLATYRDMRRQPTLALVRGTVFNDILAGSWSVEADEGVSESTKKLIEDAILPHRTCILRHALTALDYENAPFEVVPKVDAGNVTIERFKPLRTAMTQVLILPKGELAGLRNGQVNLYGPGECFLYVNDPEPGDYYGRSRLEGCREPVAKWYEVQTKIGALMLKESGTVVKVTFPAGNGVNAVGTAAANRAIAEAHARNMSTGSAWLVVENALAALTAEQRKTATVDQIVELLKIPLWQTENMELGGNGPSIMALQAYAAYLDVQIVRGYLMPERSVLEGTGDKTGVGVHSDTGTTGNERVEADIVESLNNQTVNWLLGENRGDKAKGTVRIKANPLRDVQEGIDTDIIHSVASGAATADEFYRTYDLDAIAERRGIPKRKTPLPPPAQPTQPANGKPGVNGNGNGRMKDANGVALSRMMDAWWGEEGEQ